MSWRGTRPCFNWLRRRWRPKAVAVSFDYGQLDRAITDGSPRGFAKLIGDPDGRLAGATIAASAGGEAIGEMAAWLSNGSSIDDISRQVHAYPTLAEGPSRAAHEYVAAKLATPRNRALARPLLAGLRGIDRISKSRRFRRFRRFRAGPTPAAESGPETGTDR